MHTFSTLEFYPEQNINFDALAKNLVDFGYKRHAQIDSVGDFSIRGGILDIYPSGFTLPVRIEMLDDVVETVHSYDPASGQRLEPHKMVIILPFHASRSPKKFSDQEMPITQIYVQPIDPFVYIEIEDTVVHVLHGIARYRGIKHLKNKDGKAEDFFTLEFAEKNVLYVPANDLHLIQRYVAFGKAKPELSTLGSKRWDKLKETTKKGVLSFAAELLSLQAKRKALKGHAFPADSEWQKKLEEEFPYKETQDQIEAIKHVKKDLESSMPMDRLLCGDVGYGKTEVALRAAFKVVAAGKQVAMLVPTTLLAEQHYETFTERMKNFPVSIGMLSRFQTAGEQDRLVEDIKAGACDIVIGTHRLLSKDVAFKDLGLVIIDEEQRFGVRHKEYLKSMRMLVDVLTLSATPIPRTLYLSLVGAKDMSTINTPPTNRKPIQTIVKEFDEGLIRQALKREIQRKGQAFYIYNRVQTIEKVAKRIAELLPEARVAVGHGQMPPKVLESVMKRFIHGEIDVLVSTTIIESGIDIPNANTLIVERADLFGLSELYQLRGRVGRFDRDAYSYFLVPKGTLLSEESQRRLRAIEKFTYLGSGFNLAMEDLEIRGSGNILGTEQHGHITNVGFDLYCRILKEAVNSLNKSIKNVDSPDEVAIDDEE